MERMRFWNGVGVTDTMGGCVTMGIYQIMGVEFAKVWVVDEGTKNMKGTRETADVVVMVGMGPSCETTRGKVGEGDVTTGTREGEIDIDMSYINLPEESQ
ncbi:hypothetical protein KI387_026670, partial [Taxus chinensis]